MGKPQAQKNLKHPKKSTRGAKGKKTPLIINALCKAIRLGLPNIRACELVGLSQETFYQWEKSDPEFSEKIKKARSERIEFHLTNIKKAAEKNWTASAWILERTEPEYFGQKSKIELPEGTTINIVLKKDGNGNAGH